MKKWMSLLLAAALFAALLTGCTGKTDGQEQAQAVDLEAFWKTIEGTYELGALEDIGTEAMDSFYPGLSDYTFQQFIGKMPMMSSVVSEYIFCQCQSEEDAQAVEAILKTRVDTQANGGAWYPESMDAWAAAKVTREGTYVAMVASFDETEAITSAFEDLFKN